MSFERFILWVKLRLGYSRKKGVVPGEGVFWRMGFDKTVYVGVRFSPAL